jgi:hypothetical protein
MHRIVLYFKGYNSQILINTSTVVQLTLCINAYGSQIIVKLDYDAFNVDI